MSILVTLAAIAQLIAAGGLFWVLHQGQPARRTLQAFGVLNLVVFVLLVLALVL